MMASISMKYIL